MNLNKRAFLCSEGRILDLSKITSVYTEDDAVCLYVSGEEEPYVFDIDDMNSFEYVEMDDYDLFKRIKALASNLDC